MTLIDLAPAPGVINAAGVTAPVRLVQDADHLHIDWTLGAVSGQVLVSAVGGLTINGADAINFDYTGGDPLPNTLHLNGSFTLNGLAGSNPLANTNLEIGKSTVFISYPNSASDPIATIRSYLRNGYNNALWNGTPTSTTGVITSAAAAANVNQTTAIGYVDSADGSGINTMANSIELKYTLYADTGLLGTVGFADFSKLTQTYGTNSGGTWDTGDWNYDGSVNFADFSLLTRTYGQQLGSQAATPSAAVSHNATLTIHTAADPNASHPKSRKHPARRR